MAAFETIFLLNARKTISGIFFTPVMTLLDRTWSEKSNGAAFRAIRHSQRTLGQCENLVAEMCTLQTDKPTEPSCPIGLRLSIKSFDRNKGMEAS
jgi:hypothetical protein